MAMIKHYIHVQVGYMDSGKRRILYAITGKDQLSINRALATMGFTFQRYDSDGTLVFGDGKYNAWYTLVESNPDHKPTETL